MKKLLTILLGLGLFIGSTLAQPEGYSSNWTLTTGRTVTDSLRLKAGELPAGFTVGDITNATTAKLQVCYEKVPATWLDVQSVDGGADYSVTISDSAYIPFDPTVTLGIIGKTGDQTEDYIWVRLAGITAEAADKTWALKKRYF